MEIVRKLGRDKQIDREKWELIEKEREWGV